MYSYVYIVYVNTYKDFWIMNEYLLKGMPDCRIILGYKIRYIYLILSACFVF